MLEWGDDTRHWWRHDKDKDRMVHRASNEAIVYRGPLPTNGWHKFDYQHADGYFPLIVEIKRVEFKNPSPNAYNRPPWNTGSMRVLRHWVWHVDYERTLDEWKPIGGNLHKVPPYWLWSRADTAIVDAALLWPSGTQVQPADELALNSGWANGMWQKDYYRRIGWREPLLFGLSNFRLGNGIFVALPLDAHVLTRKGAVSRRWIMAMEPAVDGYGRSLPSIAPSMRQDGQDCILTRPVDSRGYHGNIRNILNLPLTNVWDGIYLTAPLSCTDSNGTALTEAIPTARWEASLSASVAIGEIESGAKSSPRTDGKVVARDVFFQKPTTGWQYNRGCIDHALSSYSFWREMFDARMNALPFCPGFRAGGLDGPMQGEVGTILVEGGYIGGLQGMRAEVRLKPALAGDGNSLDWRPFF